MRLFIKKVCIALLVFATLTVVSLVGMMWIRGRWNEIVLVDIQKRTKVESVKERKLVFVGGSNLSYGLDSRRIQDSLRVTTYNMGLHAGIGLSYMLHEASLYMNAGDILVIVPEYNQFTRFNGSSALADLLIQSRRWKDLGFYKDWGSYPSYFCARVFVPYLLRGGKSVEDPFADNPKGFDDFGDYVLHLDQPRREFPRLAMEKRPDPREIKRIADRIKSLSVKGIRLILLPPPYAETSFSLSEAYIDIIRVELERNQLPFAVAPDRYRMSDSLFWNSAYHLGAEGREIRTERVIEDLRENGIVTSLAF